MLEQHRGVIRPNVFVVSESADNFFCWEDYENEHCFSVLREMIGDLHLENIVVAPTLKEFVLKKYGEIKFYTDLIAYRKQSTKSFRATIEALIEQMDVDDAIRKSKTLKPLADVLFLPVST
jgi:hypothetical protein